MKAENFCFWLQGFFELGAGQSVAGLTAEQVAQVKTHLALVFKHDPTMEHPAPQKKSLAERVRDLNKDKPAGLRRRSFRDGVLYC